MPRSCADAKRFSGDPAVKLRRKNACAFLVVVAAAAVAVAWAGPEGLHGNGTEIVEPRSARSLAEITPPIVAEVNGVRLTREQLGGLTVSLYGRSAMNALIAGELVRQEARKRGVSVTREELEAYAAELAAKELDFLARKSGFDSFAQLEASGREPPGELAKMRVSAERRIRALAGVELLTRKLVRRTISITPEEVRKAYERQYGPRAEILQIVLDTREEALAARRKLQLGADFAKLAREISTDHISGASDGKMPPVPRASELGQVAFSLAPGEISGIIQTPDGFHIIKLVRLLPASEKRFEDVREALTKELAEKRVRAARRGWLEQLRSRADVKRHF